MTSSIQKLLGYKVIIHTQSLPGAEAHQVPLQWPFLLPAELPGKQGHRATLPNPQPSQPEEPRRTLLNQSWVQSSGQAQCSPVHPLNMPDPLHPYVKKGVQVSTQTYIQTNIWLFKLQVLLQMN